MRILISSIGTSTAINLVKLIKKIKKETITIIGTDINEYGETSGSLMVDEYYKVPLALDDNYIPAIKKIIDLEKIDIFFPINDYELDIVSQNIDKLDTITICSDTDTNKLCFNKYNFSKFMEKNEIKIPVIYENYSDVLSEKVIKRDKISVGSKGIEIIDSKSIKKEYFEKDFEKEYFFYQEFIKGKEFTVDVFSDSNGDVKIIIPRERMEIKSGVATKIKTLNELKLIEDVKKISKLLKIKYLWNIQFIKDNSDGEFKLIELNPRFGGMSIASVIASKNYIEDLIFYLKEKRELENFESYQSSIKWNSIITRYFEEMIYYEKE